MAIANRVGLDRIVDLAEALVVATEFAANQLAEIEHKLIFHPVIDADPVFGPFQQARFFEHLEAFGNRSLSLSRDFNEFAHRFLAFFELLKKRQAPSVTQDFEDSGKFLKGLLGQLFFGRHGGFGLSIPKMEYKNERCKAP